jgi:hypothetical protein
VEESKNFMDEDDTGDDETHITHMPLQSNYTPKPIIGARPNFGPEFGSKSTGPGVNFNKLSSGGKDSGIVYGSKYRGSEPVMGSQRPDFLGKYQARDRQTN